MNHSIDILLTELRTLVADLGKEGGCISPSVYDTAQVLRLYPPQEDSKPAVTWLLAQQQPDGGWGSPAAPYARDVPTLAAVLALHARDSDHKTREVVEAGLAFLRRQAEQWAMPPLDALPIAAEMILPYLIEEANRAGLALDPAPYAALYRLKQYKLQQITKQPLRANMPPTYSWEALGGAATSILPDRSGGIGHSPAATVAWLRQAEHIPALEECCAPARHYLKRAAAATGLDIPGVVPNIWPLTGFERSYALYALLLTGILQQPALQQEIEAQVRALWITMQRGHGVSFGEYFTPDADDTGVATSVLQATAHVVDPAVILQFRNGDHFCTFHHELNPSVFANAHALCALTHVGVQDKAVEHFLLERQAGDGRWLADKWHSSWLYTTLEVVFALQPWGHSAAITKAVASLVQQQREDGGWGSGVYPTQTETSYALITLATLQKRGLLNQDGQNALQRGYHWLQHTYQPESRSEDRLWLGKELYAPYRVDRVYTLSALSMLGR